MRSLHSAPVFVWAAVVGVAFGACGRDPQVRKQEYLASGDQYLDSGKVSEAIIEYRNAVQVDPLAGDARVKLGDAYVRAGEGSRALDQYIRASDVLPDDATLQVKTSSLLLMSGRFDDAKLRAEKVLEKEPANLPAQILLANALAGLKDFSAAIAEIEEALKLDPERGETYTNLGAIELGRGQRDAAERAFKRAVELDEKSASARIALANFYWAAARWKEAEEQLLKVVELEPSNVMARRFLASFYIATNRVPEAEPHLVKLRDITQAPEAAFALADYYAARKDEKAARGVLNPLAQAANTAAFAEVKLAWLDRRSGNNDEAYKRLARVLESDRTNLNALLVKSLFLRSDGRLEEAFENATIAAERHQQSAAALYTLGSVQAARRQPQQAIASFEKVLQVNPRATDAKIALARLQLASGNPDTSLGLAKEAAARQPRNPAARLAVIQAMVAQKDYQGAEKELRALAGQVPDSAAIESLWGAVSLGKKDNAAARKHFERALELDSNSYEAVAGVVSLDLAARRTAEARARVDAHVAKNGQNAAALMLAARTYAVTGDAKQTEVFLRRVIEVEPSYLEAYGLLAQLYIAQKRIDAAMAELTELAKHDPRPVGAYTLTGMLLLRDGKTAEATEQFTRALQLDPEAAVAANNLAWIYANTDDQLDRALELALRAKAKLPQRPEINDTVGWVYYRRGMATEAIQHFERSVQQDADNPIYHYHLGLAHVKNGDPARGKVALERALKLKPNFPGAEDASQTLQRLAASGVGH